MEKMQNMVRTVEGLNNMIFHYIPGMTFSLSIIENCGNNDFHIFSLRFKLYKSIDHMHSNYFSLFLKIVFFNVYYFNLMDKQF